MVSTLWSELHRIEEALHDIAAHLDQERERVQIAPETKTALAALARDVRACEYATNEIKTGTPAFTTAREERPR